MQTTNMLLTATERRTPPLERPHTQPQSVMSTWYLTESAGNCIPGRDTVTEWEACVTCPDLCCVAPYLVLSEYKKQVVFYHKKHVFYYKKQKNKKKSKILFFFVFFRFLYFFHVQSNVLSCFLHSLWLITWKQLLTVPLTHYVTAGRWIEVLWNERNTLYWLLLSYSYCCIIKIEDAKNIWRKILKEYKQRKKII